MTRSQRAWCRLLLVACFVAVLPAIVFAQKITGDISGAVKDSKQAVVAKAKVTAVNKATKLTRSVETNSSGEYRIAELPVGVYAVTVSEPGFKTTVADVQVQVSTITDADFVLEIGETSETITVEGSAPLIELSDSKLNNYVDEKRISDLPLNGRDFNSLLGITPGVQRAPGGGFLAVNITGARRTANNYMVDGISNNDRYYGDSVLNQTGVVGIPATLVPMEAIQEFVVQQTPGAEFGVKGGAAINVVLKSGTNEFHGGGQWFRHTDATDARNFFASDITPLRNQQYGAHAGGPIWKDRTFFFGYYEGQRFATLAPFSANVPTPQEVATAKGLVPNPNRGGLALLGFYPTSPSGKVNVAIPNSAEMDSFSVKIDHHVGERHLIVGRYVFGDSLQSAPAFVGTLAPPPPNPPDMFNSVAPSRAQLLGLSWTWTLSPSKILESRFGLSRFSQKIDVNNKVNPIDLGINTGPLEPEDFGVPAIYYLADFGYIGGVAGYPITTRPNMSYEWSEHFTWVKGNHTMKMGGNWQHAYTNSLRNRARTELDIFEQDHVAAIAQLLRGEIDTASRAFGSTRRLIFQDSVGAYFSNDWKVRHGFTISFGMRYDVSGALGEERDRGSNFFPERGFVDLGKGIDSLYSIDKNNFGPRIGVAWDIFGDGKTALRGGYALAYDIPNFGSIHAPRTAFVGGSRAGAFTQINQGIFAVSKDNVVLSPTVSLFGPNPVPEPPFNAFSVRPDLKTPMIHYFNVTLQREITKNNVVTVSYVGSRGRDLLIYRDLNASPIGGGPRPFANSFPTLAHVIQLTNDSKSWYDSMQVSLRQQNWRGFNIQYNLTWAKSIDYDSINRGSRTNFPQFQNPYRPESNKGPSDHDVRVNFNVGGTYSVPKIQKLGILGDGWQFASVFTALTGRPFTPNLASFDRSGQDIRSIRADCNGQEIRYNTRDPENYIANPEIFSVPAAGRVGTCGRNILRGPGLAQVDFSIIKNTRLKERYEIEFRWEMFNLFNRANFGTFTSTNVRSGAFGIIQSTPDVDAFNPVVAQGGPRSMQAVLKLRF